MDPTTIGSTITTGLNAIAKVLNIAKDYGTSYYKDSSLPEATKLTRVEPITIVSKDLLNNSETKVVLNSLLSIFTGYYLQAVDLLTKVSDVEVVGILDRLNPDRDETGFLLSEKVSRESFRHMSMENYFFRLPTHSRPALESGSGPNHDDPEVVRSMFREKLNAIKRKQAAVKPGSREDLEFVHQIRLLEIEEKDYERSVAKHDFDKTAEQKLKEEGHKLNVSKHNLDKLEYREKGVEQDFDKVDLDALANLSIGRIVNVKIAYTKQSGDHKGENRFVTIPISVRLLVSSIPSDSIARIMTYKNHDLSLIERIHSARSGRIEFIRDLILCQDLIDEYKKATIQDPTNVLLEMSRRANNAKKFGILNKNPSLVAASSLFVISDAVAREVESKLGGKLDNARIREKAFESTYAMIVAVVSEEWQTVTFYTRGIARGASFGFKELEGKSKGTGPDIGDIMKAITSGQPPSF